MEKRFEGTEQMRPRWERVLDSTNNVIGEAIGKVYVAETFPPEAKASAEERVKNLLKAFDTRIKNLEWMLDSSKHRR